MLNHWKTLATVLLIFAAGCGGGQSPTTAINGGEADQGPALKKPASDPQHPVVLIETSMGNISLRLDAEKSQSPGTVANFLAYANAGHYEQTMVHQVCRGQGFLAGGYGRDLVEKHPRTPILNEARNGLKNRRGTIAMVRLPDSIDSATCQFLINSADNPALDHRDDTPEGYGYCVFGEVTDGMDVVDKIVAAPVQDSPEFDRMPTPMIVVKSIRQLQ